MQPRVNNFDQIVALYNSIKPLVSKHHSLADDIRPIDKRSRKHERVVEIIQGKKYALTCNLYGDDRPPITWERLNTGDFVTVDTEASYTQTYRQQFLHAQLPVGLSFINGSTHYMGAWDGQQEHRYYAPRAADKKVSHKPTPLVFKHTSPSSPPMLGTAYYTWRHVSGSYTKPTVRVDKEKKKALKPYTDEFFDWLCAVGPLLPTSWSDLRAEVRKLPFGQSKVEEITKIIQDPEHELRVALACDFIDRMQNFSVKAITTPEQLKSFRSRYNTWVNHSFKLATKTLGE